MTINRVLVACAVALIWSSLHLSAQSEAGYRANIGKTAFNATTGVEVGKIVDVALMNGIWVYKINRGGRIVSAPVATIVAKASTVGKGLAPIAAGAKIDDEVLSTAFEFRAQLPKYFGTLESLTLAADSLSVAWTSAKCDAFEAEIIDLLLSIKRTQKTSPAIHATRTCGGKRRSFEITGPMFQDYRTGKVDDAQVLKGIK